MLFLDLMRLRQNLLFHEWATHHIDFYLQGVAPLTLNLSEPDPVFNGGFMPLTASKEMTIKSGLSNSFGFGGTNSCLLFTSTN